MAKRNSEKTVQQPGRALDESAGASTESSFNAPVSDAASQFSKETISDRKKKGWTKSLRKATSSILYMAMPPTSADHVPMVVAQTPMSPDRLIPTLHSPILQMPSLTTVPSTTSATSTSPTASAGTRAPVLTAMPFEYMPVAATSSTASVASSSIASSSFKPRVTQEPLIAYPGSASSAHSNMTHQKEQSSSSTVSSSSSTPKKRSLKGKERAEPILTDVLDRDIGLYALSDTGEDLVVARSILLASPPSSPPILSTSKYMNGASLATATLSTSLDTATLSIEGEETFPSPPPSPTHIVQNQPEQQDEAVESPSMASEYVAEESRDMSQVETSNTSTADLLRTADLLPMIPPNLSRFSFLDANSESVTLTAPPSQPVITAWPVGPAQVGKVSKAAPVIETRQDIVVEGFEDFEAEIRQEGHEEEELWITSEAAVMPSLPGSFPTDPIVVEEPMPVQETANPPSLPGSFPVEAPVEASVDKVFDAPVVAPVKAPVEAPVEALAHAPAEAPVEMPEAIPRQPKIEIASQIAPSERRQKTKSMVVDVSGFPIIPPRSLGSSRTPSRSSGGKQQQQQRTVKNAPWIWHQDGVHHQRLESHQILSKEQVFEQFHLDLEQEGPNGFFLFKLVKGFKRQDPSLLAISSSLLDAELSSSPVSSPSNATPTSILESLEAVSVSQKLKRQLLLQKRKKQRKSSSDNEEDENLEGLLAMSNNNSSLQNLNSSLQEVIDAVDCLKDAEEWTSLLNQRQQSSYQSQPKPQKPTYPDSEGEYTSRDKEAVDMDMLEKRRGVYATGRLDGMNLVSKKRYKTGQRRSSMNASSRKASVTSPSSPGVNGADHFGQDGQGGDRRGSETLDQSSQQFKKHAVSQLHIYSRNGLKFKFDVMEDNELHFVEASKKYTFMDPLAAHRQPDLDVSGQDRISPLRSPSFPLPPNNRRTSSGTISTITDASRPPRRSSSSRSKSTLSSSGSTGGRRVFVTRLGRHTLLTYAEYKVLAKSASSFTLGAKLLIQRSIAVATPSFYSSNGSSNGRGKDASQVYEAASAVSPTKATFGSSVNPTPTPAPGADSLDYFSIKKKPRVIPGFASKAVAALKSPSTPSTSSTGSQSKTSRPIVTPYNPADYKKKSLAVSMSAQAATTNNTTAGAVEESPVASTPLYTPSAAVDIPRAESPSPFPLPPNHVSSPSEPLSPSPPTPMSTVMSPQALSTSSPPVTTPSSSSSSSNLYGSIKRTGNQTGLKFQHLFVTVHQRLQKLELDNGASFYGSALVQWTVIEDAAELRWWRDKIGIQMIGRLEGDEAFSPSAAASKAAATGAATLNKVSMLPQFSSAISVRSSYVSAESSLSDATSTSPSSSSSALSSSQGGYKSQVSVERLGYRFLRVSGHMGTLKVTVSEQVEARAVALAVKAEMLRQKRMAQRTQQQQQQQQQGQMFCQAVEEDYLDQPWVEASDSPVASDDDHEVSSDDDEEKKEVEGSGVPIQQPPKTNASTFYDVYEYDEWTGRTRLRKEPSVDRFSRRKRHDRAAKKQQGELGHTTPLIERMTMIVGQAKSFKGDWYMKNVYKVHS